MSNRSDALRALADLMDKADEGKVEMDVTSSSLYFFGAQASQRESARFIAESFRPLKKEYSEHHVYLRRTFGDFTVSFVFDRGSICRKETVTKQVTEWVCDDALLGIGDEK